MTLSIMKNFISVNKALIIINCIIMAFMFVANYNQYHDFSIKSNIYVDFGAIVPNQSSLFTIFSSMFLHANLFHLCMNMMSLKAFKDMEKEFGIYYLPLYLVSGLVAGFCIYLFGKNITLGASGAICGIWGANLIYIFFYQNDKKLRIAMMIDTAVLVGISLLPFVSAIGHFVGLATGALLGAIFFHLNKRIERNKEKVEEQEQIKSSIILLD